jgi:Transposase DDE domain
MRKRNWREYNKQLVQRGSITFLIDPTLLQEKHVKRKKRGRPLEYSDSLIIMLMMIKIHYRLTYRALQGFIESILITAAPCYTLVCKRAGSLKTALPKLSSCRPSVVILDASGVKVCGEGEWKVKVHGKGRPRKWVKIHIAIDAETQEIVAEATTESSIVDAQMTTTLLEQVPSSVTTILGDGAYDGKDARGAIFEKGARSLIPPPKNARYKGLDDERDDALLIIRGLGGGKRGRALWGKLTGYSKRALVETSFSRMKRLFGDKLFSQAPEKQLVENRLRCLILNKMRRASI